MVFRRYLWWGVLVLVLAGAVLLSRQTGQSAVTAVACQDVVAGCVLPEAGLRVRFDRQPRPMQPFRIDVELPEAREVHVRFAMHGMEMGLNRYKLLSETPGRWHAEVLLPACVQGRSDWSLLLETNGSLYEIPFKSG